MDSLSPRLCFRISKNSSERPAQHDCHQMSLGTVTTTLHSTAVTNYRAGPQASQEWERKAALSCWAERLGRRIYPVRAIRNRNMDSLSPRLCFRISKNSSERPAQHDCHQMSLGTVTTTLHSTAVTNYRAGPQASQEWERKAALSCWAERLGRRIYPVRAIRNRNRDSLSPCLCFRTQEQQ